MADMIPRILTNNAFSTFRFQQIYNHTANNGNFNPETFAVRVIKVRLAISFRVKCQAKLQFKCSFMSAFEGNNWKNG